MTYKRFIIISIIVAISGAVGYLILKDNLKGDATTNKNVVKDSRLIDNDADESLPLDIVYLNNLKSADICGVKIKIPSFVSAPLNQDSNFNPQR